MEIKDILRKSMVEALKSLSVELTEEQVAKLAFEHPSDLTHGDYSSNVAMVLAKELKVAPKVLAERIVAELIKKQSSEVAKIEVAGPGFVNFYLSREFFTNSIEKITNDNSFGHNKKLAGQKIIVEYTNTNVLKPLHIGHLMGNVIGESLARVFTWSGAEVKRDTYQGDVGLHIAKTLWGIEALKAEKPEADLHAEIDFIGKAYACGATAYEDEPKAQEEIKSINKKMFDRSDKVLNERYGWARQVSLDHFEELYKKLGTKFDYYFFESEVEKDALKVVAQFLDAGIFEKSDGAVVFKAENINPKLHTRVFVNSQGIPTYEAKDIAHAVRKFALYPADCSIIITANEQDSYFKVVLTAIAQLFPAIASTTKHLSHGILKFTTGKMSSRKGNVITGESLISDMEAEVRAKIAERDFTESEKSVLAEQVAVAAIKYTILRQAVGGDIIFDPEKSISFEGDSGPYLQYAHTRTTSILKKASDLKIVASVAKPDVELSPLERILYRFPEVVERVGTDYAPNYLTTYLIEVASAFNSYYADHKIVDAEDASSPYRVALTQAVERVLAKGLYVLGIAVPERM